MATVVADMSVSLDGFVADPKDGVEHIFSWYAKPQPESVAGDSGTVVQEHWWRREGHVLCVEDLGRLLDSHPELLIIGSGAFGRMRPDPGLGPELAARGVTVEVLPTAAAVDRINELLGLGRGSWAGALHLTC
jgi:hypothetical protein